MSLPADIQSLIDILAGDLDQPVELDDHRFRSLAYSSHLELVDEVRMTSILRREAPPPVVSWLETLDVRELRNPRRIGANDELGMSARVCVPVRFNDILLGFLWLIDEPTRLSEAHLELAVERATEIAEALYTERILDQDSREEERRLLETVVGQGGESAAAAEELVSSGLLAASRLYVALVLVADDGRGGGLPHAVRVRLIDAAERLRRTVPPHHALVLVMHDGVMVTLLPGSAAAAEASATAMAEDATRALSEYPGWTAQVGVGGECNEIVGLADSCREARLALWAARARGDRGEVAHWSRLGAYRTIATLVEGSARVPIPPSLRLLLANDDADTLIGTLECYLDFGGDARAAAASLYLHRSSLYGRLRRIEQVAGVDLHSGEDRLELHLGLRVLRLEGRLATAVGSSPSRSRQDSGLGPRSPG